jgi:hypothetical protein
MRDDGEPDNDEPETRLWTPGRVVQLVVLAPVAYVLLDLAGVPIRNHWADEPWRSLTHAFASVCAAGLVLQFAWLLRALVTRDD